MTDLKNQYTGICISLIDLKEEMNKDNNVE